MEVGATDGLVQRNPRAARFLLIGSAWYLNSHPVQNTYTAISHRAYKDVYCVYYQGATCPGLLHTLFTIEPTTGKQRVDLLGRELAAAGRARTSPRTVWTTRRPGWRVTGRTPYTVLWTRRTPMPGAGGVAWASPGTTVSSVDARDDGTSFRVDSVPADGGTVVLSLLDWPGYTTDVGSLGDPVDGYLVTVHLPASAQGSTVNVDFHPPGWTVEVAAWALALTVGTGWSVWYAVRRRRRPVSPAPAAPARSAGPS